MQQRVVQFAREEFPVHRLRHSTNTTVKHVFELRLDRLVDEIMEWNERIMGMNVTTNAHANVVDKEDWRMGPLKSFRNNYTTHVAHVCGELPLLDEPNKCKANIFSFLGLHMCMENMGGRIFAGFACLLDCAYKDDAAHDGDCYSDSLSGSSTNFSQCEHNCNDRCLSLTSLDDEILD